MTIYFVLSAFSNNAISSLETEILICLLDTALSLVSRELKNHQLDKGMNHCHEDE